MGGCRVGGGGVNSVMYGLLYKWLLLHRGLPVCFSGKSDGYSFFSRRIFYSMGVVSVSGLYTDIKSVLF